MKLIAKEFVKAAESAFGNRQIVGHRRPGSVSLNVVRLSAVTVINV